MRIYLDLDDTLADFTGALRRDGLLVGALGYYHTNPRETWTEEQAEFQTRLNIRMDTAGFWRSLNVLPGAFELLAAAAVRADTYILTAMPSGAKNRAMIAREKREWACDKLHVPSQRVITCLRSEKMLYAFDALFHDRKVGVQHVLLDDATLNVAEWKEAGGVGLLHKNFDDSLKMLKAL